MNTSIEQLLSDIVIRTAKHYDMDLDDALALVAQSKFINNLCEEENSENLDIDQICKELFDSIAKGQS